jgi:hypothetical protein
MTAALAGETLAELAMAQGGQAHLALLLFAGPLYQLPVLSLELPCFECELLLLLVALRPLND